MPSPYSSTLHWCARSWFRPAWRCWAGETGTCLRRSTGFPTCGWSQPKKAPLRLRPQPAASRPTKPQAQSIQRSRQTTWPIRRSAILRPAPRCISSPRPTRDNPGVSFRPPWTATRRHWAMRRRCCCTHSSATNLRPIGSISLPSYRESGCSTGTRGWSWAPSLGAPLSRASRPGDQAPIAKHPSHDRDIHARRDDAVGRWVEAVDPCSADSRSGQALSE